MSRGLIFNTLFVKSSKWSDAFNFHRKKKQQPEFFGLYSKNAESTRRKVVVTFYSIVLWTSTHRGHERPGEHELQLLHPSTPEKSRGEGPVQLEANVCPPPSLIRHHCLGRRAAWHLVTEESSSGWSLGLQNIHISQKIFGICSFHVVLHWTYSSFYKKSLEQELELRCFVFWWKCLSVTFF